MGVEESKDLSESAQIVATLYEILAFAERKSIELFKVAPEEAVALPLSFVIGTLQYVQSVLMNADVHEMVEFGTMMVPRVEKLVEKYQEAINATTH